MKNNEIEDFYNMKYTRLLGDGCVGKLANFIHWKIESGVASDSYFPQVLEVGSGNGEHLKWVKHKYDKYIESDIRLRNDSQKQEKVFRKVLNAECLVEIKSESIDRLVATCLIVHLTNPENALMEWRRVVNSKNGEVTIYVPCEPGFLLRLVRYLTTRRKASKLGYNHLSIHYREHRNSWILSNLLISEVFSGWSIRRKRFPFGFLSWNFSLFDVYHITPKT